MHTDKELLAVHYVSLKYTKALHHCYNGAGVGRKQWPQIRFSHALKNSQNCFD